MSDQGLQIFSGMTAAVIACVEADFLIGISGLKRKIRYFLMYVSVLFGGSLAANILSFHMQSILPVFIHPSAHIMLAYGSSFISRSLCGRLFLGLSWNRSFAASMILISTKMIADTLFPLLLFSLGNIAMSISGDKSAATLSILSASIGQILAYIYLLRLILKKFWPGEADPTSGYLHIVLVPCTLLIFTLEVSMNVQITEVSRWSVTAASNSADIMSARSLIALLLSVSLLFVALYSYRKLGESLRHKQEAAALAREVEIQRKYVSEAMERYEYYKSFRHDLKNHLLTLSGLLSSENCSGALSYLKEIGEIAGGLELLSNSGNAAVDVLISQKLGTARMMGNTVTTDIRLKGISGVSDYDLCVILSNLIDNAVNACSLEATKDRFIEVTLSARGEFLIIKVRNGCPDEWSAVEGQGLRNVGMAAQKYGGTYDIEISGGFATTSVLVCLNHV